jgi:hypothetical protein
MYEEKQLNVFSNEGKRMLLLKREKCSMSGSATFSKCTNCKGYLVGIGYKKPICAYAEGESRFVEITQGE